MGYVFGDPSYLRQALAHRSWCAETPGERSNERLEFLGDAVLGWVVADIVYRSHAEMAEGKLTDLRKAVVNATALAQAAQDVDLGRELLLGKGEALAGGRLKPSILSDAMEAVIGAVYLDGGTEAAHRLIVHLLGSRIDDAASRLSGLDNKTNLQELSARLFEAAPSYRISENGPDHDKRFFAVVSIGDVVWGEGEGRSKKQAEQGAAREACAQLHAQYPTAR